MPSAANPGAGRAFESDVAKMERSLAGDPNVTDIQAPGRLRDRVTRQLREHDVLVTHKVGHDLVLTAIECRDRSRPVGVPEIEAFSTKCRHTGIDRAVIVSRAGFTTTALTKAAHENIRCYTLQPGGESLIGVHFGRTVWEIHAPVAQFSGWAEAVADDGSVFRDDGAPFDFAVEMRAYIEHFSGLPHERSPGFVNEVWYPIQCHDLHVRNTETGLRGRFRSFCCIVTAACTEKPSMAETVTYSDLLNDKVIAVKTTINLGYGGSATFFFPRA